MWTAFILAFVVTAAFSDAWRGRIPRWLTVSGAAGGLLFHAFFGGVLSSVAAGAIGFLGALMLFQLGAIGGGDVKLITALGTMLGLEQWGFAMAVAILTAGGIALAQVLWRKRLRQTLSNMAELARGWRREGLKAHPVIHVRNRALARAPFGVAAAAGTFASVLMP